MTKDERAVFARMMGKQSRPVCKDRPCADPVVERVVGKLRARSRTGVRKYGTTLAGAALTLRQWLTHLQEELLDAANYVEAAMDSVPEPKRKTSRRG